MVNLALAIIVLSTGVASQYAPGVMERVVSYRQTHPTSSPLPTQLPNVDGYIAVLDCSKIGEVWFIQHNDSIERFLVADCAGSQATRDWMLRNNVLVEVDYETAVRWNVIGHGADIAIVRVKNGRLDNVEMY